MTFLQQLSLLIKKNIRLLIRAKSSALIVIFAPLLLILLIGLSYNTSSFYGLNIGVHSASVTEDVNQLISSLQEQDFKVVTYDDVEVCKTDITYNFIHACVSVPDSFAVTDNTAKEVTFYIDQSRINLVWIVQEALKEEFNLRTQELSQDLVSNIFEQISAAQSSLEAEKGVVDTIKSTTDGAKGSSDAIFTSLGEVDIGSVSLTVDSSALDAFSAEIASLLNESRDAVEDAQDALDALNSSTTDSAESELDSADSNLDDIAALLDSSGENGLLSVEMAFITLEDEVASINGVLSNASEKLATTSTDVSSLGGTLEESSASLSVVIEDLEAIKTELGSFAVSDISTISSPLVTNIETVSAERSNLNYVFPSLLTLIVMFLAIMLGDTLVMMEKTSQAYMRNFLIPVKKVTFVLATVLTNLLLLSVQLIIILFISLFFMSDALLQFPLLFLVLLCSAAVFTLVGMAIGYAFSSEETGILASISTGSLFLFLSGLILPIEGMSVGLRQFIMYNPFVITEKVIREVFIFGAGFGVIFTDLLILLGYALVLFCFMLFIDSAMAKEFSRKSFANSGAAKKASGKEKSSGGKGKKSESKPGKKPSISLGSLFGRKKTSVADKKGKAEKE